MKKWFNISAIFIVAIMVLTTIAACAQQQTPAPPKATGPIVINLGVPMPLSGTAAPWGQIPTPLREGFIQVLNKDGFKVGDQTYNFKLIQVDDENTPEGGSAAAKELIEADNCKYFVGHWAWNFSAIANVTNPAKVIFMTRNGAPDALPAAWGGGGAYDPKTMPYVVFATPSQEEYIADCFALIDAFPNYKKLATVDSSVSKGGPGWAQVEARLTAANIRHTGEWFTPGTTDWAPMLTRLHDQGVDVVFVAGWVGEYMAMLKQRWELGYKDMHIACSGPFVSMDIYQSVVGVDAFEGAIGAYEAPWAFKKTTVNPAIIAQCRETLKIAAEATGGPYEYTGEFPWVPAHTEILMQAMQQAGTVSDPDAIMKAIRGGTFDTTAGKWTMSGAQSYGSPIVFGTPASICSIQNGKEVYLSEHPMEPLQ